MKKILFSLLALCLTTVTYAQWQGTNPVYFNSGSVGIGTSNPSLWFSPDRLLHIEGSRPTLNLKSNGTKGTITFTNSSINSTNHYGEFHLNHVYSSANPSLSWLAFGSYPGGTSLAIRADGNVGIGTISPAHKLHVEGGLLLDVYGNSGHEKGMFFREGFSTTNKYNLSFLAYDHNAGGATPDGISINGYDGVSFSTGSNSRNERMRIAQNGKVGIGTTTPTAMLQIKNPTNFTIALEVGPAGNSHSYFRLDKHAGKDGGILFTEDRNLKYQLVNNNSGNFNLYSYSKAATVLSVQENTGNLGIGTTTPTEKLSVDGNILAKKVRVSIAAADWPDYVFEKSYKIQALSEVENFIKKNQHLPEVPSAKEVKEKGLDLGDMDATLLKKVEELTLYLIQENKEKNSLKSEVSQLKKINKMLNNTLNEILQRLEKLEKD